MVSLSLRRLSTVVDAWHELLDVCVEAVEEVVGGLGDGAKEVDYVGLHEIEGVAVPVGGGGLWNVGDGAAVEVPDDEPG